MKNRSIVLGVCAGVFATAGAVAFAGSVAQTVYVRIQSEETPAWHCVSTGLSCSDTGSSNCYVKVAIDDPATPAADTNGRKLITTPTTSCVKMFNTVAVAPLFNPPGETVTAIAAIE